MISKQLKVSVVSMFFIPIVSFAATHIVPDCALSNSSSTCGYYDLISMFNGIVHWVLIMTSVIAGITFVLAGIKILTHPSSSTERTKALGMFRTALIGLAVVILAWTVVKFAVEKLTVNPESATQLLDK